MNLTVELTALRTKSRNLGLNELAKVASDLSRRFQKVGDYEKAYEALGEFWPVRNLPPKVDRLDESAKAEILLRVGSLAGCLGEVDQIESGQEWAKDLITKSIEIFQMLQEPGRVAEAQGELALCYYREGSYDEARITLRNALDLVGADNTELHAILLIRAGIVATRTQQLQEAIRYFDQATPLVEKSIDHSLKGSFHNQYGLVLRRFATPENREDYFDRALIQYAAASDHFEQAGNSRAVARVENNLGYLHFTLKRYEDAHRHLDRARNLFLELNDIGTVAQVDETRARTLLAEGRLHEAQRMVKAAVKTLEKGGQQALLAEALTTQATIMARLGEHSRARALLQRAIEVAETCGDLEGAGRARLSIIEELSGQTRALEMASIFHDAADLLQRSQDPTASRRLVACGRKVIDALLAETRQPMPVPNKGSWEGFSLKREIKEIESRFIERALRDAGGSVSKASRMLGFRHHQSLISLLNARHSKLQDRRSIKRPRRHALLSKMKRGKKRLAAADGNTDRLSILHVEHHRTIARWVQDLLTAEGFHVDTCTNGATAWEILKADCSYDAVIIDNNLAGLSGLELVLRLRSIAGRRSLPIIMLSAEDCEKEAWRAGVDAFLKKPEGVSQLPITIARALDEPRKK